MSKFRTSIVLYTTTTMEKSFSDYSIRAKETQNSIPDILRNHTQLLQKEHKKRRLPTWELARQFCIFSLLVWLARLVNVAAWSHASSQSLEFVYIHGTNQNTPDKHENFNRKVAKLHPLLLSELEQDPVVQKHLLQDGQITISPKTINFFWGDLSQEEIQSLHRGLFSEQLKGGGLNLASRARTRLDLTLHDDVGWKRNLARRKCYTTCFIQWCRITINRSC